MPSLRKLIHLTISSLPILPTLYALKLLTNYLVSVDTPKDETETVGYILYSLGLDSLLLLVFLFQHSVLNTEWIACLLDSEVWKKYSRCIYVCASDATIILMFHIWHPLSSHLWHLPMLQRPTLNIMYQMFTWYLLFVLLSTTVMFDLGNVIGFKQVYYHTFNMGDPSSNNSVHLNRYRARVAHGSVTALVMLLWACPTMTYDRFLLSLFFTAYMYLRWKPKMDDYYYLRRMWIDKKAEFSRDDGFAWRKIFS